MPSPSNPNRASTGSCFRGRYPTVSIRKVSIIPETSGSVTIHSFFVSGISVNKNRKLVKQSMFNRNSKMILQSIVIAKLFRFL